MRRWTAKEMMDMDDEQEWRRFRAAVLTRCKVDIEDWQVLRDLWNIRIRAPKVEPLEIVYALEVMRVDCAPSVVGIFTSEALALDYFDTKGYEGFFRRIRKLPIDPEVLITQGSTQGVKKEER